MEARNHTVVAFSLGYLLALFGPDILAYVHDAFLSHTAKNSVLNEKEKEDLSDAPSGLVYTIWNAIALPCDMDKNKHMNNASYFRVLNYSRRQHFYKLGIWPFLQKNNYNLVIASQSIRYRKEILLFENYFIRTAIVAYNDADSSIWVQSWFEKPKENNFSEKSTESVVLAVHLLKYKLLSKRSSSGSPDLPRLIPSLLLQAVGLANSLSSMDCSISGNVPVVDSLSAINRLN